MGPLMGPGVIVPPTPPLSGSDFLAQSAMIFSERNFPTLAALAAVSNITSTTVPVYPVLHEDNV